MKKSFYSQTMSSKIPILFFGEYFLPIEVLKRRLDDEATILTFNLRSLEGLFKKAAEYQRFVIVFHVTSTADLHGVVELLKNFHMSLSHQQGQVVIVSGAHCANLKKSLAMHTAIEVLPNTVEAADVSGRVLTKYRLLMAEAALPAETPEPSLDKPAEKSKVTRPADSGLVLVKGDRQDGANTVTGGAPEATPSKPETTQAESDRKKRNVFHPVTNLREIASMINDGIKSQSDVLIFNEELTKNVTVRLENYNLVLKLLTASIIKGQMTALSLAPNQALLVNFNLKRGRVFFRTESFKIVNTSVTLEVPKMIYDVQRRSQMRLPVETKQIYADVMIAGHDSSYQIFDVSSTGICLVVPERLVYQWMSENNRIEQIHFSIGEKTVSIGGARIAHCRPKPETPGMQLVGCEFFSISNRDQCLINMYVYKESLMYVDEILGSSA